MKQLPSDDGISPLIRAATISDPRDSRSYFSSPPALHEDGISPLTRTASVYSRRQSRSYFSSSSAPHVHPKCECRELEAPQQAIREILASGGIPLISIGTSGSDKLSFQAKRSDGQTAYVVVQHTHRNGLACAAPATLTTCQLFRLALRLGELQATEVHGELCFWLDTLCEDRAHPAPPSVFRDAHAVLIVDSFSHTLRSAGDLGDVPSYLASIIARRPRLALNGRHLLMSAQGFFRG